MTLIVVAVMGCRSRPVALSEQHATPAPVAVASTHDGVQLTECYQADANRAGACQQTAYQVPAAEPLPPAQVERPAPLTLAEAIAIAVDENPRLRQELARVGGAQADVDVAYAPFLPQVGMGVRYADFSAPVLPGGSFVPASLETGVKDFFIAEAGLQWTLYDFGRTQGRYEQAVDCENIASLRLARAKQTIAFEAAQAYFRVLAAQANLRVRNEALQRATSVLDDTNARFANGDADREDVLRAEVEVAQIQEEIFGARQAIRDAESTLNVVLGRSAVTPLEVVPVGSEPAFRDSIESCLEIAANSRREISMARAAVAEARHGLEAARGELLPKVYVRSSVIQSDSTGPLNGWIEGVGLHVDQWVYTGGALRGEVRRSQEQVRGACATLQSILDQVTLQVRVSYEAINTDLARIRLGETTVGQARENLRLTTVKYNNGTATPTDMVDAQTALIRAQTAYTTAVYSYLTDLAQLQYAMGNDQEWLLEQLRPQDSG